MPVLYKENDYIVREVEALESYVPKGNSNVGTQIVFGTTLFTPNVVKTYETPREANYNQGFYKDTHGSSVRLMGLSVDYSDERIQIDAVAGTLYNKINKLVINGRNVTNFGDGTFINLIDKTDLSQSITRIIDTRSAGLGDIGQLYFDNDPYVIETALPGLPLQQGEKIFIYNLPEIPLINGKSWYVGRLDDLRDSLKSRTWALYRDAQLLQPQVNASLDGNPYRTVVDGFASITPTGGAIYSGSVQNKIGKGWQSYHVGATAINYPGSNFGSYNIFVQYNRANRKNFLRDRLAFPDIFESVFEAYDDRNQELLWYYENKETSYFDASDNHLELQYTRFPIIRNPNESGRWYRVTNEAGNCLLELLQNPVYGLGIADSEIEFDDFYNVGELINGAYDLENSTVKEIIANIEQVGNVKLVKDGGKIRLYNRDGRSATTFIITDDVILSNINVQIPDRTTVPTGIRAVYKSHERGLVNLEIGTGPNFQDIFLNGVSSNAKAVEYLKSIFKRLTTSQTYTFTIDKTGAKLLVGDKITLTSSLLPVGFTGLDMIIIDKLLNDDFTYTITATYDTAITNSVKQFKRPILPIDGGSYRPPEEENPVPQPDPDDPPIDDPLGSPIAPAPAPGEITPPAPTLRTYSGLNHPYNFTTGADNTDWYLGALDELGTVDSTLDSNGIRTIATTIPNQNGIIFRNTYGLIYRPTDKAPPVAVWAISDVGNTTAEKSLGYAGYVTKFGTGRYRFHFDNIFNENVDFKIRAISNRETSWRNTSASLQTFYADIGPIYGNTPANSLDYVYTCNVDGTFDILKKQYVHTYDPRGNVRKVTYGTYRDLSLEMKYTGRDYYRLHYFAIYSSGATVTDANKIEYIGSTSFYGDGRGVQAADLATSQRDYAANGGIAWPYGAPSSPPSRSGA